MYQDQQDGMGKGLLLGFLVGGIAGAVAGLLLAPKPGKEIREDIKRKSGELKDNAKKVFSETTQKVKDFAKSSIESSDAISETVSQTTKFSNAVKSGYEAYKDELERS